MTNFTKEIAKSLSLMERVNKPATITEVFSEKELEYNGVYYTLNSNGFYEYYSEKEGRFIKSDTEEYIHQLIDEDLNDGMFECEEKVIKESIYNDTVDLILIYYNNERDIYESGDAMVNNLIKRLSKGEDLDIDILANSSIVRKIVNLAVKKAKEEDGPLNVTIADKKDVAEYIADDLIDRANYKFNEKKGSVIKEDEERDGKIKKELDKLISLIEPHYPSGEFGINEFTEELNLAYDIDNPMEWKDALQWVKRELINRDIIYFDESGKLLTYHSNDPKVAHALIDIWEMIFPSNEWLSDSEDLYPNQLIPIILNIFDNNQPYIGDFEAIKRKAKKMVDDGQVDEAIDYVRNALGNMTMRMMDDIADEYKVSSKTFMDAWTDAILEIMYRTFTIIGGDTKEDDNNEPESLD